MVKPILCVLLGGMNLFTFLLYCIDKRRAVRGQWRISERTLLGCSILGGSLGGGLAMLLARHKIRKRSFRWINGLCALAQVGLFIWLV